MRRQSTHWHGYLYDGMGKQVQDDYNGTNTSYHIYDVKNTKLAAYSIQLEAPGSNTMGVDERYIFGSDRLATLKGRNPIGWTLGSVGHPPMLVHNRANQQFELHDHLGNVRATIDRSAPTSDGIKEVTSYFNNYAFGSPQRFRTFDLTTYSFGFNGQERRDDYAGVGNHNHALYWEYETRTGRRWNIDPVVNPNESPYATFRNGPIWKNDPSGDFSVNNHYSFTYDAMIQLGNA